jgi:transcriptional regulator with XRE-family HTH domain
MATATWNSTLGSAIRDRRRRQQLTIARLAERADIDPGFLAYIETGKKSPSLATASKLAEALGLSLAQLFHGVRGEKTLGFRTELVRFAQTLCHRCTKAQADDLMAVLRIFDDHKKVRAIRTLVDA